MEAPVWRICSLVEVGGPGAPLVVSEEAIVFYFDRFKEG